MDSLEETEEVPQRGSQKRRQFQSHRQLASDLSPRDTWDGVSQWSAGRRTRSSLPGSCLKREESQERILLNDLDLESGILEEKEVCSDVTRTKRSKRSARRSWMEGSIECLLGEEETDVFHKEVAQKVQGSMWDSMEAEKEVYIDILVKHTGSLDKALLLVLAHKDYNVEVQVQLAVNLLLDRGASPSEIGSDWQSPLHHAVRKGFRCVVKKLLENRACSYCTDKNNKLPLHLALEARNDHIAADLLEHMPNVLVRRMFKSEGPVPAECNLHDLIDRKMKRSAWALLNCMVDRDEVDSSLVIASVHYDILESDDQGRDPCHSHFRPNAPSCLHLIAKGGHKDLVQHLVVRLLVQMKWKAFARWRFKLNCAVFLLTTFCLTFALIVAVDSDDPTRYHGNLQHARAAFEIFSLLSVSAIALNEPIKMKKHGLEYFTDLFNLIDVTSSVLLLAVVPLRFTNDNAEWFVFAFGYMLWNIRIFKYASIFRHTGAYVQILWRIVSNDILQFTVIFCLILIAFSGSFVLCLKGENSLDVNNQTSNYWNVLFTGLRTIIEGQPVVGYISQDGYRPMSTVFMVGFLFVSCVVLLNILIAQMSDTYKHVQKDARRGLELNRAKVIARLELNSFVVGKSYRQKYYTEKEQIVNPESTLDEFEAPVLAMIEENVNELRSSLASAENNFHALKDRLSRQESSLSRMQADVSFIRDYLERLENSF